MAKKRNSGKDKERSGGGSEVLESESLAVEAEFSTKSNKIVICKASKCFDMATIKGHCRLHYLANWKKIKSKEAKKEGKELESYLQELALRFPEEYLEKVKAEVEEMAASAEQAAISSDSDDSSERGFDSDSDEDMETIIKGIRIEDF